MKLTNLFNNSDDNRAVSPVIGVILMVAITVILAAVIGTFVLGLGQNVESAPQASFNFQETNGGSDVKITHRGGDNIQASDLEIRVDGTQVATGSDFTSSSFVRAGNSHTITSVSSSSTVDVVYTGGSGEDIIGSYEKQ